jgi:phage terminase large subunit-like protein
MSGGHVAAKLRNHQGPPSASPQSLSDFFGELAREKLAEVMRGAKLRAQWRELAREEQLPPGGAWRVWYVRGGRGAGKTRTGAETLAGWILDGEPGEWAVCAPTFGDARSVCAEGPSGLVRALGGLQAAGGMVTTWNRSEGVLHTANGSVVYLDGANDGAFRIQGKNLRGLWADEVGLWEKWDRAWNESIQFAVRMAPGRIIATGTPKMAHPLIAQLLASPNVVETHMRTIDNAANLDPQALDDLHEMYGGSTLGRQELEGEFIEALEGEILHRTYWQWYEPTAASVYANRAGAAKPDALPAFEQIVHSWDTALKDKTSSDFAAGQVWGVAGADRYLLRLWHGHAGLNATIAAMRELRYWAGDAWPRVPQYILIENNANGPDAIDEMRTEIDGVKPFSAKGDKVQRALSAAVALETKHCHLPGFADTTASGRGYDSRTHEAVQGFVEECAHFRGDMKHAHDDQVDAWSQMVNWTRGQRVSAATIARPRGRVPQIGSFAR